jgi:Ca2+-transporting ATPase
MAEIFWHNLEIGEMEKILRTDIKNGLSEKEVKSRQKEFGKNKLPEEKPLSGLKLFFEQFKSPLIYILVIAGIVALLFPHKESGILAKYADSIIIFCAVFLNTIIGFFQENKTSKILAELKKIVKVKTYVIREGNEKEVEQEDLVPGDLFLLHPGNKVPADGRLVEARNLKINESFLTGEWIPAEKKIEILPQNTLLADRDNMVFMGTIVEDGLGKAICTETGLKTEIGKIAQIIREAKEEKTPYQRKVANLSKIIGILIIFLCLLTFGLGIAFGQEKFEMFLTSVAVAVAAVPEGLPVAITVILALGMQRILKKQGLVRKMVAAETLGSTSIICTDKTGTLTEAKMKISEIFPEKNNLLALKIATLASDAFIENPEEPKKKWVIRGRPTEKALVMAGVEKNLNKKELEKSEPEIDRIPFDPVYKYSTSLRKISQTENILYILGTPEKILEMSKCGETEISEIKKKFEEMAGKGERVLATAYKKHEVGSMKYEKLEDLCKDLTFVGLISLKDPLRPEVKEAIKVCQEAGMRPIIVTGDHKLTAKAIAEELGLPARDENIIEGEELEKISDEEFEKRLEKIEIYARVEPKQKLRIISAWQKKGKVVAMTGDGINDAPALKKADIGLALGSGTDVAKEASDLVLLNDSFTIIISAIEEGRQILDNIRKVIVYLLSDSFTEVILIAGSVLARLPFLPVLAGQILWVNLIEDSLPALALAFEPKEKGLMKRKPEDPKMPLLNQEMRVIIFAIGIFTDFLLFSLFVWLLGKNLPQKEVRTIIFAGLAIDSLFYVFSCKNLKKNIWHINPFSNLILTFSWLWGVFMLLIAIYLPFFQKLLKTVPLNLYDWGLLLILGFMNLFLIEATKFYFIAKTR